MARDHLEIARLMLCTDTTSRKVGELMHRSAPAVRYAVHRVCWGIDKDVYDAGITNKTDEFGMAINSKPSIEYLRAHFAHRLSEANETTGDGFYDKRRTLLTEKIYLYVVSACGNHIVSINTLPDTSENIAKFVRDIIEMANKGKRAFYTIGKPMAGALVR